MRNSIKYPDKNVTETGMHKCIPYESSRQIPIYQDAAAFGQRKKPRRLARLFIVLALPIFPASHPASIVGADELNFCVRDGNRWTLIAINTNYADGSSPSFMSKRFRALTPSSSPRFLHRLNTLLPGFQSKVRSW